MSVWSSISKIYKKVDRKYFKGKLPGGASSTPKSSGKTSTGSTSLPTGSSAGSSSTTTNKAAEAIRNEVSSSSGGGGSSSVSKLYRSSDVRTVTTPEQLRKLGIKPSSSSSGGGGGSSSGGKISSGTSSAGSSSTTTNKAAEAIRNEVGTQSTQTNQGNISPYEYTGKPPQRYNQPLSSSIKQSFKNILNFGIIGQQGFSAYAKQAFFEPFEYTGKGIGYDLRPKMYKEIGYNTNPVWRGTEFGYNLTPEQKKDFTPEGYKDTSSKTFFSVGEGKKKELFSKAGLTYKGEPPSLLPVRLRESIVKEKRQEYQQKIDTGTAQLQNIYQQKINTGELTLNQAQTQFASASQLYESQINQQFNTDIQSSFNKRYSPISADVNEAVLFQAKISEPGAYPIIRNVGRGAETAAIIGATTFGGSGATFAASAYLGYKTASQGIKYEADYYRMTPEQKITGGLAIGFGGLATAYTANLGLTKFYGEWRGIIYEDLARSPAKITGKEVLKTESLTRYNLAGLREQGVNTALTAQRLDVRAIGTDRAEFFSKGLTYTRIFDPQTTKFITTREVFATKGAIPSITFGDMRLTTSAGSAYYQEVGRGLGYGFYRTPNEIRRFGFLAASKDKGNFYRVVGGADPNLANINTPGYRYGLVGGTYEARFDSSGKIFKLFEGDRATSVISTAGAKSSRQYISGLYNVGGASGVQITQQAQKFTLGELGSSATKMSAIATGGVVGVQTARAGAEQAYVSVLTPQIQGKTESRSLASVQLPQLSSPKLQTKGIDLISAPKLSGGLGQGQTIVQITAQAQKLGQISKTSLRTGFINPTISRGYGGYIPPQTTFIPPFSFFGLSPGGLGLTSNIITGGKKNTKYAPSFSALVFNLRGIRKKSGARFNTETGINFRPITPKFKFKTGLNFNFKGMKRLIK